MMDYLDEMENGAIDHLPKRFWVKVLLLVASAGLLTLSLAPFGQFYLAWFGVVPWMVVVAGSGRWWKSFLWGWLGGYLFFQANLAYLMVVTVPGSIALSVYMGLFWAVMGVVWNGVWRCGGRWSAFLGVVMFPVLWTGVEWLRGTLLSGMPWLYLGHSQSPILALCQIADVTGVYGISFVVGMINAVFFGWVVEGGVFGLRGSKARAGSPWYGWRVWIAGAGVTVGLVVLTLGYGFYRLGERTMRGGPRVMVVQPNDRFVMGKSDPAKQRESLEFHMTTTLQALRENPVDLVVWSETTMPPLNAEVRQYAADKFPVQVHEGIAALTNTNQTSLLAGGYYVGDWKSVNGKLVGTDIRNSAYLYDPFRRKVSRYDKIHIVPFGEFIPFRVSLPWLFQAFMWLSPYHDAYTINAGSEKELTVFTLDSKSGESWRFVSPICFEDIDAPLVARMFRDAGDARASGKRADFILNLTNDGWFRFNEMPQHLQAAIFRSIENRAPTARSVNTGVSGFIDSCGRTTNLIGVGSSGTATQQLMLDSRVSFYTRHGDVFAIACVIAAGVCVVVVLIQAVRRRGMR